MFSKKATKIDELFTVDLTLCSKCQIDGKISSIFMAFLENTNFKPDFFVRFMEEFRIPKSPFEIN